jgi:hypothetical protein
MNRILSLFVLTLLSLVFFACEPELIKEEVKETDNNIVLTDLIQYDVLIKNTDQDQDWFVQNMEGRQRDEFVKRIMQAANSGEYRLYNYFFNTPLSVEEINATFNRTDSVTLQRPYPPYDWYDTVMVTTLDEKDITKVRFLEEWYIDENKLKIEKKIVGIAPMMENYNEEGVFRGYVPLFWIYLDEKYPVND